MANFRDFLATFSDDSNVKGAQFERFVKWFLKNDPVWKTLVEQVWHWYEYPESWGKDLGIDLVFRTKSGELWAVQAKCYSTSTSITKAAVDSFISESDSKTFSGRLLIGTTDRLADNAKKVCDRQKVTRFLLSDFDTSSLEYPSHYDAISTPVLVKPPEPLPHQSQAIAAVKEGFQDTDRGQLIMACGTGKTFTTLWIKEALEANSALILLPSLGLLSQTLHEWTKAASQTFEALCVCSDDSVGKKSEDESFQVISELPFPVTSDPRRIQQFLALKQRKVVFCTYQSSPLIAQAQAEVSELEFDLIIADEAHRCAGVVGDGFSSVLNDQRLRGRKRLFATATPRTYSKQIKSIADGRGIDVVGMDDVGVFGRPLYTLSFGEAIERSLLTDYRVVIVGVDDAMLATWIESREIVTTDTGLLTDAKSLAASVGLLRTIEEYGLRRLISFHSRVKSAQKFAHEIHKVQAWLSKENRLSGNLKSDYVSGEMPANKRRQKLSWLKNVGDGEIALLSNAKCLSEGVDVPSLDGVAFIDPKNSQIDIIQSVGRAIRRSDGKTAGTIVLPVFIEKGDTPEEVIARSEFKQVWAVIAALKAHDEILANEIDQLRTEMGKKGSGFISSGLEKVIFDLPRAVDPSIVAALRAELVISTSSSWDEWFGLLLNWREQFGITVPEVSEVYRGYKLGGWAATQRSNYIRGWLSPQRIKKLESLDGWTWDLVDDLWKRGLACLKVYWERHKTTLVPDRYVDTATDLKLGQWVKTRRLDYSRGRLLPQKIMELEKFPDWSWDPNGDAWKEKFNQLKELLKTHSLEEVERSRKSKASSEVVTLATWIVGQKSRYLAWKTPGNPAQRYRRQLTLEEVAALESLRGWSWDRKADAWKSSFVLLKLYLDDHSMEDLIPDTDFRGVALGRWNTKQRAAYKRGALESWKLDLLIGVGWDPDPFATAWEQAFSLLQAYVEEFKIGYVPQATVYRGFALGRWVTGQRTAAKANKLTLVRHSRLAQIPGWSWDASSQSASGISKRGLSPTKLKAINT